MTSPVVTNQQLRFVRATHDDLDFVAWCNYEASSPYPGFCYWDPLIEGFGTETMTFIRALFQHDALMYGRVEDFLLVEHDGVMVGGASTFVMDADDYRPFILAKLPTVAQALGWTDAMLDTFLQRYSGVWSDPKDETLAPIAAWTIECVAVKPEVRGQGIAKALMHTILEEARDRGLADVGISVTAGNDGAQRVYEAAGFKLYLHYGAEYFYDQFPGTLKYRIRLT